MTRAIRLELRLVALSTMTLLSRGRIRRPTSGRARPTPENAGALARFAQAS